MLLANHLVLLELKLSLGYEKLVLLIFDFLIELVDL